MATNETLEELMQAPLGFMVVKDQSIIDAANSYLPYSIGMEINAVYKIGEYDYENFKAIPDIMLDAETTSSSTEQRYRIPNGIVGLICLWNLSKQLKINCELNPIAGIHYHVDCKTDGSFNELYSNGALTGSRDWILRELDTWEYKGNYNARTVNSGWVRFNGSPTGEGGHNYTGYQTIEFRIGEMTFDYELLLKRILHVTAIVRELKSKITVLRPVFRDIDVKKQLRYQKEYIRTQAKMRSKQHLLEQEIRKLEELNKKEEKKEEEIIIRKRVHKL